MSWPNVKPGWYVVALLFLYSLLVTLAWQRSEAAAQRTPANGAEPGELVATVAAGEVGGALATRSLSIATRRRRWPG